MEEDGFVGEGRRKGDLKPWTLIGGDEAWMSLRWHSAPDICLALNNTLDRVWEWWPPGRLTLQPVPRWATLGHSLSSPSSLCVSLFLSLACQYASTCLMGPSEELTADMLVSLFPPAILLDLASVISHATDKQLRLQHLSNPPSTPSRDSVITKEEQSEAAVQSKNLGWLHFSNTERQVIYLLCFSWSFTKKKKTEIANFQLKK